MDKDYKIEVKVKNNLLYKAMVDNGYETAAEIARKIGVTQSRVGDALNLKTPLYGRRGNVLHIWISLSRALHRLPEDLLPIQHHNKSLRKNKGSFEADIADIKYLLPQQNPENLFLEGQVSDKVLNIIESLTTNQSKVIKKSFGIGCEQTTIPQIAEEMNLSRARVDQIQKKALRVMGDKMKRKKENINQYLIEG